MVTAGRPDMAESPKFARNHDRVRNEQEIDDAISAWTESLPFDEVLKRLEAADVPAGPIYSIADQKNDPHFQARGLFESVTLPDGDQVTLPRLAPVLSDTPGETRWPGPPLGAHNDEILAEVLGLKPAEIETLRQEGVL